MARNRKNEQAGWITGTKSLQQVFDSMVEIGNEGLNVIKDRRVMHRIVDGLKAAAERSPATRPTVQLVSPTPTLKDYVDGRGRVITYEVYEYKMHEFNGDVTTIWACGL